MEILNDFGIKPILLLAQVVNFLVLLYLLKRFLFGPILKVLEERKQKIAESLENSEKIRLELEKTTLEREKKIQQASKEAKKIIEQASLSASQIIADAHKKAAEEIEKMIAKGQIEIKLEKDKLNQEIRAHLADLVALSMQKITGKVLDDKTKKDLLANAIKEFES